MLKITSCLLRSDFTYCKDHSYSPANLAICATDSFAWIDTSASLAAIVADFFPIRTVQITETRLATTGRIAVGEKTAAYNMCG